MAANAFERFELKVPVHENPKGYGSQTAYYSFKDGTGARVYAAPASLPDVNRVSVWDFVPRGVRFQLIDSVLSLYVGAESRKYLPKLHGLGVVDKASGEAVCYALPDDTEPQVLYDTLFTVRDVSQEWLVNSGDPRFFSWVEEVAVGDGEDEFHSSILHLNHGLSPESYAQALACFFHFAESAYILGMWHMDVISLAKDPFLLSSDGQIKILDTSGFVSIRGSQAQGIFSRFYDEAFEDVRRSLNLLRAESVRNGDELDKLIRLEREHRYAIAEEPPLVRGVLIDQSNLLQLLASVNLEGFLAETPRSPLHSAFEDVKSGKYADDIQLALGCLACQFMAYGRSMEENQE